MKEGLLGGVFSTGWPLLNLKDKPVTLAYREATLDGRRLHEIDYHPKQGFGDMKIKLYFDMETYRHVRTEYRLIVHDDMSAVPGGFGPGQGLFERRAARTFPASIHFSRACLTPFTCLSKSSTISRKSVR